MSNMQEDVLGYDCRNSTYCRSTINNDDLLVIKEYKVFKDGRREPGIRCVKNFKRPFYVTRDGFRNHKQKKEWEDIKKLQRFECTQAELPRHVARALGMPGVSLPLKQLANNPYLYGTDIRTGPLVKKQYQDKWPQAIGPLSTVAVMDIETDVVNLNENGKPTEEIIIITLSFKDKVITGITRSFLGSMLMPEETIRKAFDKYLGEYKQKRNINLELYIGDTPADICKAVMAKAHEWMPDFITFWNINFDMPKIIAALVKEESILEDVFSDPRVPHEYRHFKYIEGPAQKVTQDGSVMALHPADRWHTVRCPASFYFLDSMCLYKRLRTAKGQEPSYSLDSVLERNLKLGKLKIPELEGVSKLEWHVQMQKRFKAEYVVYNIFDCIGVELLDEKTGDISQAFAALCELSDFDDFKSNPRRIITDLHFFCLENDVVIAACGTDMKDELDEHVIGLDEWIVTLAAHMGEDNGLQLMPELPDVHTNMKCFCADLDIEGTYPSIELAVNISKETTKRELSKIKGIPERLQRLMGVNLTGGTANAVEICQDILKLPDPVSWRMAYEEHKQKIIAA